MEMMHLDMTKSGPVSSRGCPNLVVTRRVDGLLSELVSVLVVVVWQGAAIKVSSCRRTELSLRNNSSHTSLRPDLHHHATCMYCVCAARQLLATLMDLMVLIPVSTDL